MRRGCRCHLVLTLCFLVGGALALSACSDSDSGDGIELTSNADTYEIIPGIPPPAWALTLVNHSSDPIVVTTCSEGDQSLAQLRYQQYDTRWTDIPWNEVACGGTGVATVIAEGTSWTVPGRIGTPPMTSGTYRVLLAYTDGSMTTPIAYAVSNTFTVIADFEATAR